LKHQYHARNYQRYSKLIQDLLQAEKHDELTIRNQHQRPVGTTPLPEVNYSSKDKEKVDGNKPPKNVGKFKEGMKISTRRTNPKTKVRGKERNPSKCHRSGDPNHIVKKRNIPQHLVDLYQKSLKEAEKAKGSYEAHFNATSNEATTSGKRPGEGLKPSLTVDDYIDGENMIVEYN
jgi:hypothetical protein